MIPACNSFLFFSQINKILQIVIVCDDDDDREIGEVEADSIW